MHVIITIASLSRAGGGTSQAVASTATHLARKKEMRVTLLTLADEQQATHELREQPPNLTVRRIPTGGKPFGYVHHLRHFRQALQQELTATTPTVVHDNGIWLPVNHIVASATQAAGVPRVVSTHGMLQPWALGHRSWKKQLAWYGYQRRDLHRARVLHATAEGEAERLRQMDFNQSIVVVPNGIEMPTTDSPVETPQKPNTRRTCLFLSRVHKVKGLVNLVDAWAQVRPAGWQVVIAGPDEDGHTNEIKARVAEHQLGDVFSFVGPVEGEAKDTLFRTADLFVLPSFSENFGIVVAEALSYRVPVITTRGTPWAELETNACGWWVDVGVEPLTEALREALATSPAEREAMGARGRALILDQYTWPQVARDMAAVYKWVLTGGPPPPSVTMH